MHVIRRLILCGFFLINAALAQEQKLNQPHELKPHQKPDQEQNLELENYHYKVIDTLAHDASSFTQGLELSKGLMYESSGLYGKSSVRKYDSRNDATLEVTALPKQYFAEGLTLLGDELFLLTWKEGTLFILNPDDLTTVREINYQGEGWGLANNGKQLIMSDGSDTLYFRHAETFDIVREIKVHSQQRPVRRLNELEYAQGYLWANIWLSSLIVKIDPQSGELAGFYDLQELVRKHATSRDRVLNGIAYDSDQDAFWITGKLWPERYLVKFGRAKIPK